MCPNDANSDVPTGGRQGETRARRLREAACLRLGEDAEDRSEGSARRQLDLHDRRK